MAKSGARKETAAVRQSATSPPHQFPGTPTSTCSNPSPPSQFFPNAPTSSSAFPSTPPHFYPVGPTGSSASAIPSLNQWRPMYTPAPEGLLGFGQMPPMHMYNFQPPPMHHHEVGNQRMENYHFVGAWLECSVDPIQGNGKKSEKFWDDIAALYNSTTPSNRKRDRNQLKQEWQRTKKRLCAFHGQWIAVNGVYHSGFSTVDLATMALEKYESNYGHSFQHLTMWVKLRDDGKWLACYQKMIGRSPSEGNNLTSNVINLESEKRPEAGRDKAKTERAGKGKAREVSHELGEKLDKFIEVNNQSMEERQKVMETQVFLSNRQLETAKITNKTKMLEVYQNLLLADTSRLDDAAKAGRDKALKSMESFLFAEGDSV
ncbi:hypothetical protein ACQ4PT_066889 [Festuca glaucescens]